jgi:ABC-type cobalt transport system substrate-binding protein
MAIFVAILVTVGFFGVTWALFIYDPSTGSREALLILVGALAANFGAIVQYYFGSSAGSAQKTALLAREHQR